MILKADARALPLKDECVQCVVTSPPYFAQRDYGVVGQIGLERTVEGYVSVMVAVLREIRRVLKPDGVLFLNLGDCHYSSDRGGWRGDAHRWEKSEIQRHNRGNANTVRPNRMPQEGLKDKDLIGMPWRIAFAAQADGWWLRQEITWCKPNGMPSSVKDRPSSATEKVFLLSKRGQYYYDHISVKMPPADASISRWNQYLEAKQGSERANAGGKTNGPMKAVGGPTRKDKQRGHSKRHAGFNDRWDLMTKEEQQANGANLKNWWVIPTARSSEPHYAMMPKGLARICILAGSRPGDLILDPFGGSGTTAKVALELGRRPIHIDLAYHDLARKRTSVTPAMAGLMT